MQKPCLLFSRRQGLHRDAPHRAEGVRAGANPVPRHARRHRAQLRLDPGVPRPLGRPARAQARRRLGARTPSTAVSCSEEPNGSRNRIQTPVLLEAVGAQRLRRALRRRPARRGEGPRQGARLLLPRRVRPVGPEEPAAGDLEPLQRPRPRGREHPGLPAVELDRARHLDLHRATSRSRSRSSTSPPSARSSSAAGCSTPSTGSRPPRRARTYARKVRYRTVGDANLTAAVESDADTVDEDRRGDRGGPDHRARRHPRRRQGQRGGHGGPQEGGLLLMPGDLLRFATAGSVDDGKSTLIGRLLYDSKSLFEDQLERRRGASAATAATTTPTSRCSPTACAPSASRASRSTSPTATSRRRAASSSSPTPPGTSSTPATW